MTHKLELKTLRCGVVAWIQVPPLSLNSGTDKAKLLHFMRPQSLHLKNWQNSHFSGSLQAVQCFSSLLLETLFASDGNRS